MLVAPGCQGSEQWLPDAMALAFLLHHIKHI